MKNQVKGGVRLAKINASATAKSRVTTEGFPAMPTTEKRSKGRAERRNRKKR